LSSILISREHTSRRRRLSLTGLGAGTALAAFPESADAAVGGSAIAETISATAQPGSTRTETIPIDIDGDGNPEFNLVGYIDAGPSFINVRVEPIEADARIVGSAAFPVTAERLAAETSIDAGSTYLTTNASLAWSETKGDSGDWTPAIQRGYVGVSFDFEGSTHYGSLDVEVTKFTAIYGSELTEFDVTLHGYVWETTPGAAILAGAQPPAVPIDTLPFGLTLFAILCLLGIRSLGHLRSRGRTIPDVR
jgi:hypothetical protein